MSMEIRSRFAVPADEEEIRRLLAEGGQFVEDLPSQLRSFVVACWEERILGAVSLEPRGVNGVLSSLAVDERARNLGIATALCRQVEANARDQKIEEIFLVTDSAQDFFRKIGYETVDASEVPAPLTRMPTLSARESPDAVWMKKRVRRQGARPRAGRQARPSS